MLHSPRRCIVDYRVRTEDFRAAVEYYRALLRKETPDVEQAGVAVFKVFTANIDHTKTTYQTELRVTAVAPDSPQLRHSPAIYWGSDEVSADYTQLRPDTASAEAAAEPVQPDPAGLYHGVLGSAVDSFGYRVGVATNPVFSGPREWINLVLMLAVASGLGLGG